MGSRDWTAKSNCTFFERIKVGNRLSRAEDGLLTRPGLTGAVVLLGA